MACVHGYHHKEEELCQDRSKDPIKIPESPFWGVFKRFGRDELIAMFINVIGTTFIGLFTSSTIGLAFVGPVIEKIGFFPAHIKEAIDTYRLSLGKERRTLFWYIRGALRNGSVSLLEDLFIHDPLYVVLFLGLSLYPGVPIWLISIFSFVAAVAMVAWIEVGWAEIRYRLFQRKM